MQQKRSKVINQSITLFVASGEIGYAFANVELQFHSRLNVQLRAGVETRI